MSHDNKQEEMKVCNNPDFCLSQWCSCQHQVASPLSGIPSDHELLPEKPAS